MKKTVTFELPSVSVEIDVKEDLTEEQIRKLGEKAVVKQLSKKFPIYRWSLIEGGSPIRLGFNLWASCETQIIWRKRNYLRN